jgi:hypothetical protein
MSNGPFDVGDRPRTTWTIQLDGVVTDPPVVILVVKSPSAEQVSIYGEVSQPYPITRSSAGVYYADIPLLVSGNWRRRWIAYDELGSPLDAFEAGFKVTASGCAEPLPSPP